MKHYLIVFMVMLSFPVFCISCGTDDPVPETEQPVLPGKPDNENQGNSNTMSHHVKITLGKVIFNAILENNATATAFKALLPMTVNMSEMNGNEKFYYLPGSLPTETSYPGTIRTGDLMLYGSSCVVLFYETFRTSYGYTRLGRVDNPSGLAAGLGPGSVRVTFELQ